MPTRRTLEDLRRALEDDWLADANDPDREWLFDEVRTRQPAFIEIALDGHDRAFEELRECGEALLNARARLRKHEPSATFADEFLRSRDRRIAKAMGLPLARSAGRRPGVVGFRKLFLDRLLSPSEATDFLHSWAVRLLPLDTYESLRIPAVHRVKATPPAFGADGSATVGLWIDPPAKRVTVTVPPVESPTARDGAPSPPGFWEPPMLSETVYGELRSVAGDLTGGYPWDEDGAIAFILTGSPSEVRPLRVGLRVVEDQTVASNRRRGVTKPLTDGYGRGIVTVTAEAWVSIDSVRDAYAAAQRELLGGDNQPPEELPLAYLEFVEEWRAQHPEASPPWRELWRKFAASPDAPQPDGRPRKASDDRKTPLEGDARKMYARTRTALIGRVFRLPVRGEQGIKPGRP
jgi:hypothetical protein